MACICWNICLSSSLPGKNPSYVLIVMYYVRRLLSLHSFLLVAKLKQPRTHSFILQHFQ